MLGRILKTLVILQIFLFANFLYLSAQDRQDARVDAQQNSLQNQDPSSLGRMREPSTEVEIVEPITVPRTIEFEQRVQKAQGSIIAPGLQTQETTSLAVAPITVPRTIEFEQRVEQAQGRILAPAPTKSDKDWLALKEKEKSEKKKLAEKEKAEKESKLTKPIKVVMEPDSVLAAEDREYYIDLGDILDISVWELPKSQEQIVEQKTKVKKDKKDEEYFIDIGDTLDISVWQVPDLSRSEVIVRPDGRISFPLIGDIKAEGLTLTNLGAIITEKLKIYVKNPQVSIMIRHFGNSGITTGTTTERVIGRLDKAIVHSALSQPEVIVRPDGKISFPLIGDIKAEGLTLTNLDNIITERLKTYVSNPEVSIMIKRFGEQTYKVVALGEILSPGVYKFGSPPTITELVASAGGYTKYAVLNSIMVLRGDIRAKPEVIRVNVAQILKSGKLKENILLKPNDIIYVPRSFIGNLNTFMELLQPAFNEYMQTMNARQFHNIIRSKGGG
jgi:polysaccharide biosynthesis/export protein